MARWSIVVPVKRLAAAKSRLAAALGEHRARLALAVARDTVTAALACPRVAGVVVVTDDPTARARLRELGAGVFVTPDVPDAGLNPALAHGASVAAELRPGNGTVALSADLPALRPAELGRVLAGADREPESFLPDAAGVGTTFYGARPGVPFRPAFGGASRARHRERGAHELPLAGVDSVRLDVDTPEDLRRAVELGVGPHTAEVVATLGAPAPWRAAAGE